MKGILLAGGSGSRLRPLTTTISKQLLPVYDKPMIYYPLSTLMLAGIRQVLIISTPVDTPRIKELLGDGTKLGMELNYAIQAEPKGLAEAYIIGKDFLAGEPSCMILGDNIFYGQRFGQILKEAEVSGNGARIFGYKVKDPERYGVVEFDEYNRVLSVEEKPEVPKSDFAIVGLYVFDGKAPEYAASIQPSARGELEITDLMNVYLEKNELNISLFGRGYAWLDSGTYESLMEAAEFVRIIEQRQGLKISCIEEIAWREGFITKDELADLGRNQANSPYGQYILSLSDDSRRIH